MQTGMLCPLPITHIQGFNWLSVVIESEKGRLKGPCGLLSLQPFHFTDQDSEVPGDTGTWTRCHELQRPSLGKLPQHTPSPSIQFQGGDLALPGLKCVDGELHPPLEWPLISFNETERPSAPSCNSLTWFFSQVGGIER